MKAKKKAKSQIQKQDVLDYLKIDIYINTFYRL